MAATTVFNFNVGVLGHVDSGKTSLSKALSTVASTASFDKNPQSRERGITLDLGFSSFHVDTPAHLQCDKFDRLQFTLVDCPGHASLIKTVIGGAQIIDLMMLVIDVTKGMQTQTAECLVIGEITCQKMVVVLNKVDLVPDGKKEAIIEKMTKRMLKTLEGTRFAGCPIIPVAAKPGGPEAGDSEAIGVTRLIETLSANAYIPQRNPEGAFIFSVDHCFSIRGQGTVMTGTVVSGSVAVNDTVEIPSLKVTKKVKSIQMFKKPVDRIIQGDRAGICVTQFDPKLLERGLVATPGELPTIEAAIIKINKIHYFKGSVLNKAKFHITTGHETVMGKIFLFGREVNEDELKTLSETENSFNFSKEFSFCEELLSKEGNKASDGSHGDRGQNSNMVQYALIEFEKPVTCPKSSLVIGSKLDTDIHANTCRIAFQGKLLEAMEEKNYRETVLPKLKIYKFKTREGAVDRIADDFSVIGKNLFKKESNIQVFVGLKVTLSSGEEGVIEGGFGQSGKFKIRIPAGVSSATKEKYAGVGKKKGKSKTQMAEDSANQSDPSTDQQPIKIILKFKRYQYDPDKKMIQT